MPSPARCAALPLLILLAACPDKADDTGQDVDTDTTREGTETPLSVMISGSVVGLVNGPVTLQLNGGQDVTVEEDGTFSFSDSLWVGDAYEVAVTTAPASQVCTVTAGVGTATANVSDIHVRCECDWQDGLVEVTGGASPGKVHGFGQIHYLSDAVPGLSPRYRLWKQACGEQRQTVAQSGDAAPPEFPDATLGNAVESLPPRANGSATGTFVVPVPEHPRGIDALVLLAASPPMWTPQVLIGSHQSVGDIRFEQLHELDTNGDGQTVALVSLQNASYTGQEPVVVRVDADGVEQLYQAPMTIEGVPTCDIDYVSIMPNGDVVAAVHGCDQRSDVTEGIVRFSTDGTVTMLVKTGDEAGEGRSFVNFGTPRRDDSGAVYVAARGCVNGGSCRTAAPRNTVVRLDTTTGAVEILSRPRLEVLPGRIVGQILFMRVSPRGNLVALVATGAADCETNCPIALPQLAMWDGAWHSVVTRSEVGSSTTFGQYDVNDDGDVLVVTAPALEETSQTAGVSIPLLQCWNETLGLTEAADFDDNFDVGTLADVSRIDLGEGGHWTASVLLNESRGGGSSVQAIVAGTCP